MGAAINDAMPPTVRARPVDGLAALIDGPVAMTSDERATVGRRLITAIGASTLGASGNTTTLNG